MEANEEPNRKWVQQQKNETSLVTSWNNKKKQTSPFNKKAYDGFYQFNNPKSNARLQIITKNSVQTTEYKCSKERLELASIANHVVWQCCCCISFPLTQIS